jgi:hypothetical protein
MAGPGREHSHAGSEGRPFWVRARIDRNGLKVVTTLAYALAKRWVSADAAEGFSVAAGNAAAKVVGPGEATMNLWEEPGGLVCHIARPHPSTATGSDDSQHAAAGRGADGVEVHVGQQVATVRLVL